MILLAALALVSLQDSAAHRLAWLTRHAEFEQAIELVPTRRDELSRSRESHQRALEEARGAAAPEDRALALGRALDIAPESAAVRDLLATLPPRAEPYALTLDIGPVSGRPNLVYSAVDGAILALVDQGPFLLGSARADALPEEQPQRRIELRAFYIDRYELSNRRYAKFVAATRHAPPPYWQGPSPPDVLLDEPVTWVDHADARAYAAWAGLRLPTEIEWEKAARGPDGRTFPWGEWNPSKPPPAELDQVAARRPAAIAGHPLGASPYGCLDMSGNAIEWVQDAYSPYRWSTLADGEHDPPPFEGGPLRVLRGGAIADIPEFGRTTFRSFYAESGKTGIFGFRVARD